MLGFLPLVSSAQIYGNQQTGLIKDEDGFVLIREGQGVESPVVDTLFENEFFRFRVSDSSNWLEVYKLYNITGFAHKSRIRNVRNLPREQQKSILHTLFANESSRLKRVYSNPIELQDSSNWMAVDKFSASLDLLIYYNNQGFDKVLMIEFFDILVLNSASADETPAWVMGYIYLRNSEKMFLLVKEYNNWIIDDYLDFRFANVTYQKENEIKGYEKMNKQIESLFDSK